MSQKEYYLVLPLLLYGLAISDLVNTWRSFLRPEQRYLPYTLTSLLLLDASFWNFYGLYDWVKEEHFSSYMAYMKLLVAPLVFLLVVAVFTPEHDEPNLKDYFHKNMRNVFALLSLFILVHFFYDPSEFIWQRWGAILLLASIALTRKVWLIYGLIGFRVVTLVVDSL